MSLVCLLLVVRGMALGFPPVQEPRAARQLRGFVAVRAGKVVASENASRLFVPASVAKLFVAAAALHHLGPDHRRVTTVVAAPVGEGGVLEGDLVLRASGDPTWNRSFHRGDALHPVRKLARQVRESGVVRIRGALVVDASVFAGRQWAPGWPIAERALWYGAPVSALAVDENVFSVRLAPGPAVGAPARVVATSWFPIENRSLTVGQERHEKGSIEIVPSTSGPGLVVTGEYPISEPAYSVRASVPAPDEHAGRAFLASLTRAGVAVDGGLRVSRSAVRLAEEREVARFVSPSLAEVLGRVLCVSHNWYAEMLARILGREIGGDGRLDVGLAVVGQFLEREVSLPKGAFYLEDASGLSPDNLVTPEAVAALLLHAHRQPWSALFIGALASGGDDGTLRGWPGFPPRSAQRPVPFSIPFPSPATSTRRRRCRRCSPFS